MTELARALEQLVVDREESGPVLLGGGQCAAPIWPEEIRALLDDHHREEGRRR